MSNDDTRSKPLPKEDLKEINSEWGKTPADHFGYATDEERLAKRGMEDWEMVNSIPDSQEPVPKWFIGVVIVVLLLAIGLSFPFWGDRPGYEREWVNSGFIVAILYLGVGGTFVYFMVRMYGTKFGGELQEDNEKKDGGEQPSASMSKQDEKQS